MKIHDDGHAEYSIEISDDISIYYDKKLKSFCMMKKHSSGPPMDIITVEKAEMKKICKAVELLLKETK